MDDWLKEYEERYPWLVSKGTVVSKKHRRRSTSVNDPLQIDWIDEATTDYVGRIGMTMLPGRNDDGTEALYRRHLAKDLAVLKASGCTTLVTLVEKHELTRAKVGVQNFFNSVKAAGINAVWYPILDLSAPRPSSVRPVINRLVSRIRTGEKVVVHCRAGLGRTGAIVGAILVEMGYSARFAIEHIREHRKGTIQTLTQEEFIVRYQKLVNG
jgi:protein-tyrosine phosphatase